MEQRKGKRQLNQGVRVKRTEEKEKRADRSAERTREATAVRAKRTTESRAARGAEMSLGQKLKAIHGKVCKAVHESRERNFPESNGVAASCCFCCAALRPTGARWDARSCALRGAAISAAPAERPAAAKWQQKEVLPACLRRCGAGDRGDSRFCLTLYLRHHRHL